MRVRVRMRASSAVPAPRGAARGPMWPDSRRFGAICTGLMQELHRHRARVCPSGSRAAEPCAGCWPHHRPGAVDLPSADLERRATMSTAPTSGPAQGAAAPPETADARDAELKGRHRAMWASGDYPSMVTTWLLPLGPALVDACAIG